MSVKLMSAIFETEMRDLEYNKDGEPRKTKASTAKLVLLALADHANDYGESSYPGYDKLEIKTALSRQGLADTFEALKQNGLLLVDVRGSKLGTNSYTINIRSFPPMYKEIGELPEVVKPLDSGESSHLTDKSQAPRLEPSVNHQLTVSVSKKELNKFSPKVLVTAERLARLAERMNAELDLSIRIDGWGLKWDKVLRRIDGFEQQGQPFEKYAEWYKSDKSKFDRPRYHQIGKDPNLIVETWGAAFSNGSNPKVKVADLDDIERILA